jgi:hypothetical protein
MTIDKKTIEIFLIPHKLFLCIKMKLTQSNEHHCFIHLNGKSLPFLIRENLYVFLPLKTDPTLNKTNERRIIVEQVENSF